MNPDSPFDPVYKAWVKLDQCGEFLHFRHYYTAGKVRLHAACFCKQHLICPLCAIRRGAKTLQAYLDRFAVIRQELPELQPYLITFTVKNGPDLAERFNHLHKAFKTLQKLRRNCLAGTRGYGWTEFARVEGCVGTYEVSNIGNGWHPHLHMVALCASEPSQKALRAEWEGITGDSFMVDVRPFQEDQDPAEAFMEVMKYAVKFSKLSLADNWHAAQVLARRRLLFNFGAFRGVQVPESMADEPLDGLPYVDLFYRYFGAAGYCFTGESPPQGEGQNDRERTASKALTISRRAERNARKREKTA